MALMTKPSILLLDEPSTGLAPLIVRDVMTSLAAINQQANTTIMVVEQSIPATLKIVTRAIVLKSGRMIVDGASDELASKEDLWALFKIRAMVQSGGWDHVLSQGRFLLTWTAEAPYLAGYVP